MMMLSRGVETERAMGAKGAGGLARAASSGRATPNPPGPVGRVGPPSPSVEPLGGGAAREESILHGGVLPLPVAAGDVDAGHVQEVHHRLFGRAVGVVVNDVSVRNFLRLSKENVFSRMHHAGVEQIRHRVRFAPGAGALPMVAVLHVKGGGA